MAQEQQHSPTSGGPAAPLPPPIEPAAPTGFDRFFPGPARQDPQLAERLQAIADLARQRADQRRQSSERRAAGRSAAPASQSQDALIEAVHEQTEVLRGLLEAEIAVRDDARATAQNSRTFAVAGTVIAFFTMVAAVVTVVVAFTQ